MMYDGLIKNPRIIYLSVISSSYVLNFRIVMGKVNILPERILTDQLEGARPASHLKFCHTPPAALPEPEKPVEKKTRRFSISRRKRSSSCSSTQSLVLSKKPVSTFESLSLIKIF